NGSFGVIARLDRAIQYSRDGIVHTRASGADVQRTQGRRAREAAFPRHDMSGFCTFVAPRRRRGRRECRVQAAPMARLQQKTQAAVTTGSARSSGIPRAMVLRLIRALLGVPGLLASVACRFVTSGLDTSVGVPGPRDFAVRA